MKGLFMSNIHEREKFDDFEMLDDYDFSGGTRRKFYKPKKVPITSRLDNDIIFYFSTTSIGITRKNYLVIPDGNDIKG